MFCLWIWIWIHRSENMARFSYIWLVVFGCFGMNGLSLTCFRMRWWLLSKLPVPTGACKSLKTNPPSVLPISKIIAVPDMKSWTKTHIFWNGSPFSIHNLRYLGGFNMILLIFTPQNCLQWFFVSMILLFQWFCYFNIRICVSVGWFRDTRHTRHTRLHWPRRWRRYSDRWNGLYQRPNFRWGVVVRRVANHGNLSA